MTQELLVIDGSMGEGGGQVLRAALALSMALGQPFRMVNIRAKRTVPGLKRQHLTCIRAAQQLCDAQVEGDVLNAASLIFVPGHLKPGAHTFAIGTGGSVTLVLQALLPPLLFAAEPSSITVRGGTHVPYAPPFEFMAETLLPRLEDLGPRLYAQMERMGYMDVGGGCVRVEVVPAPQPLPLPTREQGDVTGVDALLYGHNLPAGVLERETQTLLDKGKVLGLTREHIIWIDGQRPVPPWAATVEGSGNMLLLRVHHAGYTTVFGECGWRGRSAERVARQACARATFFLRSGADIESHLADQLLVPLALAGGGNLVVQRVSRHTRTCLNVIELFAGLPGSVERAGRRVMRIMVPPAVGGRSVPSC